MCYNVTTIAASGWCVRACAYIVAYQAFINVCRGSKGWWIVPPLVNVIPNLNMYRSVARILGKGVLDYVHKVCAQNFKPRPLINR